MTDIMSIVDDLCREGKKIVDGRHIAANILDREKQADLAAREADLLNKIVSHLPKTPLSGSYGIRPTWDQGRLDHAPMVQDGNNFYLWLEVDTLVPILIRTYIRLDEGQERARYRPVAWKKDWTIANVNFLGYAVCDTWTESEDEEDVYWWSRAPGVNCQTIEEAVYHARLFMDRHLEKLDTPS